MTRLKTLRLALNELDYASLHAFQLRDLPEVLQTLKNLEVLAVSEDCVPLHPCDCELLRAMCVTAEQLPRLSTLWLPSLRLSGAEALPEETAAMLEGLAQRMDVVLVRECDEDSSDGIALAVPPRGVREVEMWRELALPFPADHEAR